MCSVNEIENKRFFWIDAVKTICMILVFFTTYTELCTGYSIRPMNDCLRPFYVNAFFFVSGYLLFRKKWSDSRSNQTVKAWHSRSGGQIY